MNKIELVLDVESYPKCLVVNDEALLAVVSYLSLPTCRFPFAVSHLPFPICRFPFAVSHLPFPILGFRPLFSGNSTKGRRWLGFLLAV